MTDQLRLDERSIVGWSSDQIAADVDGQIVVMGMSQGKYVGFDDVATAVWHRLAQPCTVTALCQALAEDFDGPPEQIRQDTINLLRQLHDLGLIDVSNDGAAG